MDSAKTNSQATPTKTDVQASHSPLLSVPEDKKTELKVASNTLLIYVRNVPPVDQKSPFQECQAEVLSGTDSELMELLKPGAKLAASKLGLPSNLRYDSDPELKMFDVTCLESTPLAPTCKMSTSELLGLIRSER